MCVCAFCVCVCVRVHVCVPVWERLSKYSLLTHEGAEAHIPSSLQSTA